MKRVLIRYRFERNIVRIIQGKVKARWICIPKISLREIVWWITQYRGSIRCQTMVDLVKTNMLNYPTCVIAVLRSAIFFEWHHWSLYLCQLTSWEVTIAEMTSNISYCKYCIDVRFKLFFLSLYMYLTQGVLNLERPDLTSMKYWYVLVLLVSLFKIINRQDYSLELFSIFL